MVSCWDRPGPAMVLPNTEAGRVVPGSPCAENSRLSLSDCGVRCLFPNGLADDDLLHLIASHFPAGSQQLFIFQMILVESQPQVVLQLLQVSQ